jgi:hypothetical protein
MENPADDTFSKIRLENNDLFDRVHYAREAVLDGENLDLISSHAARQVDALVQVPRYDALRFSQKLKKKCTVKPNNNAIGYFDWTTLGKETGTCFNAIPARVQFLAGPLVADFTPPVRKPRAKRTASSQEDDAEEEEERPEEVKNPQRNANQLSAVEENINIVSKTIKKRSRDAYKARIAEISQLPQEEQAAARKRAKKTGAQVCAIQYMFNPLSFTQTVENLFHYSFLVKSGAGRICLAQDGKPQVAAVPEKEAKEKHQPAKQAIVSLTMRDWRRMCKAYNVKKADIPNRKTAKRAAAEEAAAAARPLQSDGEQEEE